MVEKNRQHRARRSAPRSGLHVTRIGREGHRMLGAEGMYIEQEGGDVALQPNLHEFHLEVRERVGFIH